MQTRSKRLELEKVKPKIEKTCKKNCKEKRERNRSMAGQGAQARALEEYGVPSLTGGQNCIVKPTIEANTFEIKPAYIQMVSQYQFGGLPSEDPNAHLASFLDICDTFKINGVSTDAIRLRLFPFSLRDKAKLWLGSLAPNSITSWDALSKTFLTKYYPLGKTVKYRQDLAGFK